MNQRDDTDLWMVMAVIQEFRLDAVTLALERVPGFGGMTVSDCRGFGQEKMRDAVQSGDAGAAGERLGSIVDFTAKVKLEVVVAARAHADAVVETIARAAHTGRRGDGKVFVWPLTRAVRIRTMESDRAALEPSNPKAIRQDQ